MKVDPYWEPSYQKELKKLLSEAEYVINESKDKLVELQLTCRSTTTHERQISIPKEWWNEEKHLRARTPPCPEASLSPYYRNTSENGEKKHEAENNNLDDSSPEKEKLLCTIELKERRALSLLQKCSQAVQLGLDDLKRREEEMNVREEAITAAKTSMEVFFTAQAQVLASELDYFQYVLNHEQQRSFHRLQLLYARLCWRRRGRILKECLQHWRRRVHCSAPVSRRALLPPHPLPSTSPSTSSFFVISPTRSFTPDTRAYLSPPHFSSSPSSSVESFTVPNVECTSRHRCGVTTTTTRSCSSERHGHNSSRSTCDVPRTAIGGVQCHHEERTEENTFSATKDKEWSGCTEVHDLHWTSCAPERERNRRSGNHPLEEHKKTCFTGKPARRYMGQAKAFPAAAVGNNIWLRRKIIFYPLDEHSNVEINRILRSDGEEHKEECKKNHRSDGSDENFGGRKRLTEVEKKCASQRRGHSEENWSCSSLSPTSSLSSSSSSLASPRTESTVRCSPARSHRRSHKGVEKEAFRPTSRGLAPLPTTTVPLNGAALCMLSTLTPGMAFTVRVVEEDELEEERRSFEKSRGDDNEMKVIRRNSSYLKNDQNIVAVVFPKGREKHTQTGSSELTHSTRGSAPHMGTYPLGRGKLANIIHRLMLLRKKKEATLRHKLYLLELYALAECKERMLQSKQWRQLFSRLVSHMHVLQHHFLYFLGQKEVLLVTSTAVVASQVVERCRHQSRMATIVGEEEKEQERKLKKERRSRQCQTVENMDTAKHQTTKTLILIGKKFFFQWMSYALLRERSNVRSSTRCGSMTMTEQMREVSTSSSLISPIKSAEGDGQNTEGQEEKIEVGRLSSTWFHTSPIIFVLQLQLLEEEERTKRLGVYLGYFSWCVGWMQRQVSHLHSEFLPSVFEEKQALALVCTKWEAHCQMTMVTQQRNMQSYQERICTVLIQTRQRQQDICHVQLVRLHFQQWLNCAIGARSAKFIKRQALVERAAQREKHTLFADHLIQCNEMMLAFQRRIRELEISVMNDKARCLVIEVEKGEGKGEVLEHKLRRAVFLHLFLKWGMWARGKRLDRLRFRQNVQELLWKHQGHFESCLRRKIDEALFPSLVACIGQHKEDMNLIQRLNHTITVDRKEHQALIAHYEEELKIARNMLRTTWFSLQATQGMVLTTQKVFAYFSHEFSSIIITRWSVYLKTVQEGMDYHTKMISTVFTDAAESVLRGPGKKYFQRILPLRSSLSLSLAPHPHGSAAFLSVGRQGRKRTERGGAPHTSVPLIKGREWTEATSCTSKKKSRETHNALSLSRLEEALAVRSCHFLHSLDRGGEEESRNLWITYLHWCSAAEPLSLAYEWEILSERLGYHEFCPPELSTRMNSESYSSSSSSLSMTLNSADPNEACLIRNSTIEIAEPSKRIVTTSPSSHVGLRSHPPFVSTAFTASPSAAAGVPTSSFSSRLFSIPFSLCERWINFAAVSLTSALKVDHEKEDLWRWTLASHLRELVDKRTRRDAGVQYELPLQEKLEEEQVQQKEGEEGEANSISIMGETSKKRQEESSSRSPLDLRKEIRIVKNRKKTSARSLSVDESREVIGGVAQGKTYSHVVRRSPKPGSNLVPQDTRQTPPPTPLPSASEGCSIVASWAQGKDKEGEEGNGIGKSTTPGRVNDGDLDEALSENNEKYEEPHGEKWKPEEDFIGKEDSNTEDRWVDRRMLELEMGEREKWKLIALQNAYGQLQRALLHASQTLFSQRDGLFFLGHLLVLETEKSQRFHLCLKEEYARWEYSVEFFQRERQYTSQLHQQITRAACARLHAQGLRWKEMFHQRFSLNCKEELSENRTMRTHVAMLEEELIQLESSNFSMSKKLTALQENDFLWKAKWKCCMSWVEETLFEMEEAQRRKVSWLLRCVSSLLPPCTPSSLSLPSLPATDAGGGGGSRGVLKSSSSPLPPSLSVFRNGDKPPPQGQFQVAHALAHTQCKKKPSAVGQRLREPQDGKAAKLSHTQPLAPEKRKKTGIGDEDPISRFLVREDEQHVENNIEMQESAMRGNQYSLTCTTTGTTTHTNAFSSTSPPSVSLTISDADAGGPALHGGGTTPTALNNTVSPPPFRSSTEEGKAPLRMVSLVGGEKNHHIKPESDREKQIMGRKVAEDLMNFSSTLSQREERWMERRWAAENFRAHLTELQDQSASLLRLVDASDRLFSTFA